VAGVGLLAEEGLAVGGRVLDPAGQPLADALVSGFPPPSLVSFGSAFDRDLYPESRTGADGAFRLAGFDPGKVRLRVRHAAHRPREIDAQAGQQDVEIRLEGFAALSGIVVSLTDGEPVATFTVSARPSEGLFRPGDMFGAGAGEQFERVVRPKRFADRQDGTFTLERLTPGTYDVTVTAEGFGERTEPDVEVAASGRRGLVLMLAPEAALLGQVVDGRSGAPVSGALVRAAGDGTISDLLNSMASPSRTERTDAQGRFRFGGLGAGTLKPAIEHPAYRVLSLGELQLQEGEQRDLGVLRLSVGASVYGTVRDAVARCRTWASWSPTPPVRCSSARAPMRRASTACRACRPARSTSCAWTSASTWAATPRPWTCSKT